MAKGSNQLLPAVFEPPATKAASAPIHLQRITPTEIPRIRLIGGATVEIGLDSEIYPERELTLDRLEDILRQHVSSAGDCRTTFVIFQIMEDSAAQLEPWAERLLNELAQAGKLVHCQGVSFYSVLVAASRLAETTARLDEIVGEGELTEDVFTDVAEQLRRRAEY